MTRVVIVGGGRVGLEAARALDEQGDSVALIEADEDRTAALGEEYVATVIEGDGTDPAVLEQADLGRADAVAALTGTPGTNLAVCLLAERKADVRTVMRVESTDATTRYEEHVDAAVCPERTGALEAVSAVLDADIELLAQGSDDLSLRWVRVSEDAPVAGRTLSDVALPEGALVVAAAVDGEIADSETEFHPDESYLLALEPAVVEETTTLFRG